MKLFKIFYEVDNGCAFIVDSALVVATCEESATFALSEFISAKDSVTYISEVISVEEFGGEVFTGKFGYR